MKTAIVRSLVLIICVCSFASFMSAKKAQQAVAPEELRKGQILIGWTVFEGERPAPFYAKVKTTAPHPAWNSERMVVVELLHGLAGAHGMSGSPMYLASSCKTKRSCEDHGKLVGA